MKKILYFATAALALSACSSEDFLGEDRPNFGGAEELAISFGSKTAAVTRAGGADAATLLGNSFVVYGYKSGPQVVYDHYTVNFKDGSALSTESNSAGWEYVNQPLNMLTSLDKAGGAEQTIKYWDFAATQYDFVAFSIGEQTSANKLTQVAADATPADNQVAISKINNTPTYTIKGKIGDIARVYVSDRVTAKKTVDADLNTAATGRQVAYKAPVQFNFHAATAKVRMGIYETIPGYSVKDVVFYNATPEVASAPTLTTTSKTIANPTGVVTATVTFPVTDQTKVDYNKAVVSIPDADKTQNMGFGALDLKAAEHKEDNTSPVYLGRTSADASIAGKTVNDGYVNVFPCTPGALTLKVDYTLVSRDGSGETINVKGATATVPAEYGNWKPNYAYTYIFKISDNTNGQIGTETGLYPITFDAIVTETEDGVQETITEVTTPSITTYAKGAVKDEYCAGDHIYVNVNGVEVSSSNLKLYTAVLAADADQELTEAAVANAIAHGVYDDTAKTYTVTDKDSKTLVVTESDIMSIVSEIDKDDAPDGNAVTLANKAGKFTAAGSTTYVVEYNAGGSPAVKHYKVIVVGSTAR